MLLIGPFRFLLICSSSMKMDLCTDLMGCWSWILTMICVLCLLQIFGPDLCLRPARIIVPVVSYFVIIKKISRQSECFLKIYNHGINNCEIFIISCSVNFPIVSGGFALLATTVSAAAGLGGPAAGLAAGAATYAGVVTGLVPLVAGGALGVLGEKFYQ